jgi:hypothetical protein
MSLRINFNNSFIIRVLHYSYACKSLNITQRKHMAIGLTMEAKHKNIYPMATSNYAKRYYIKFNYTDNKGYDNNFN